MIVIRIIKKSLIGHTIGYLKKWVAARRQYLKIILEVISAFIYGGEKLNTFPGFRFEK